MTMDKITAHLSQLSRKIFEWQKSERECSNQLEPKNESLHMERHSKNKSQANLKTLVFDVPVVPSKISGIFERSTGALNITALKHLIRKLKVKKSEPPK